MRHCFWSCCSCENLSCMTISTCFFKILFYFKLKFQVLFAIPLLFYIGKITNKQNKFCFFTPPQWTFGFVSFSIFASLTCLFYLKYSFYLLKFLISDFFLGTDGIFCLKHIYITSPARIIDITFRLIFFTFTCFHQFHTLLLSLFWFL
jgi:hypothetical protein